MPTYQVENLRGNRVTTIVADDFVVSEGNVVFFNYLEEGDLEDVALFVLEPGISIVNVDSEVSPNNPGYLTSDQVDARIAEYDSKKESQVDVAIQQAFNRFADNIAASTVPFTTTEVNQDAEDIPF